MEAAARGELDAWRASSRGCLGLVILLDQFPRNIYRGTAQAFRHDAAARAIARDAIDRGFDRDLAPAESLDLGFTKATNTVGELGNFVGDEGARVLAEMLAHNRTLRSLDLLHNFISQVGVNHLRRALEVNRTLTSLQLTQFGRVHNEPGKEAIRAALERNRQLVPPEQAEQVSKIEFPDHVMDIYSVYRTRT